MTSIIHKPFHYHNAAWYMSKGVSCASQRGKNDTLLFMVVFNVSIFLKEAICKALKCLMQLPLTLRQWGSSYKLSPWLVSSMTKVFCTDLSMTISRQILLNVILLNISVWTWLSSSLSKGQGELWQKKNKLCRGQALNHDLRENKYKTEEHR